MADKSKNKVRMVVLAIFAIGFASGLLTMNLYERFNANKDKNPDRGKAPQIWVLDRINERVTMTADQKEQIKSILTDQFDQFDKIRDEMRPHMKSFEPRFAEVRQQSREKIRALLTEEQQPQFDKLLEEDDRKREERHQDEDRKRDERRQRQNSEPK